ncbi:MAG: transglycosylase SLT domain-containing protein [Candidatus Contendobacter sp.]
MAAFRADLGAVETYGSKYRFDALTLLTQGFQESRLDQQVKSHVGAIGIMQVRRSTHEHHDLGRSPLRLPPTAHGQRSGPRDFPSHPRSRRTPGGGTAV